MAAKQDSAWKDVIEEVGTEEERDKDQKFFVVKNGNNYAIAYYPGMGFVCTVCCKLMQPHAPMSAMQRGALRPAAAAAKGTRPATRPRYGVISRVLRKSR